MEGAERPKTIREAKQRMNEAIEAEAFELAEFYHKEALALENFEKEVSLGKVVSTYLDDKEDMKDKVSGVNREYRKGIEELRARVVKEYKHKFEALKAKQETELARIVQEWKEARSRTVGDADLELANAIKTAKILAGQMQFQKAIELRNTAYIDHETAKAKHRTEVDSCYQKQLEHMKDRHEIEMNQLISKKRSEVAVMDEMVESCESNNLESFLLGNASYVVNIVQRYPHQKFLPHSFKMQTVYRNLFM